MESKKNYYEEIQKCLQKENVSKEVVSTVNALCVACQKYYHYYLIRKSMKRAEDTLQKYFDESEYMSQRKLDMNKEVLPKYSLTDLLYLEFLGEIYDEYYAEKMNYDEFLYSEYFSENIRKCFKEVPDMLVDILVDILRYAEENSNLFDYVNKKQDFAYLHNAVKEMRNALSLPVPNINICVENMIDAKQLEKILQYLNENNIAGTILNVAPITRNLSDGSYSSYTPKSGHNSIYFNIPSEYNLKQLSKRIEAIKKMVSLYDETVNKLNEYREISV